jgi:hypothetical protein
VYIFIIRLDLLHNIGVQRSGFWTTSKQIFLRLLWLSVDQYQSVFNQQQPSQWKLWQHFKFSTTVQPKINTVKIVSSSTSSFLQLYHNSLHRATSHRHSVSYSAWSLRRHLRSTYLQSFVRQIVSVSAWLLPRHWRSTHLLILLTKVLKTFCLFYTLGVLPDKTNLVAQTHL